MNYRGVGSVSAVVVAAAIGMAWPAQAGSGIAENAAGSYEYSAPAPKAVWDMTPCDSGADTCVKVSQFAIGKPHTKADWTAEANWTVGSWFMTVNTRNAIKCEDGSKHDILVSYAWDAATLQGWRSYNDGGVCGEEPKSRAAEFSLAKIGNVPPAPAAAASPAAAAPVAAPPAAAESPAPPPAPVTSEGAALPAPAAAEAPTPPAA